MAVVIGRCNGIKKVLCVCINYAEAEEWAEAHGYQVTENGHTYQLAVEDRWYQ